MEWLTEQLFDLLLVIFIFVVMIVFVLLVSQGNDKRAGAAASLCVAILMFYVMVSC